MRSTKTQANRLRRRGKIRAKISGTAKRPRLSVFKSNTSLYAQLIDDESGVTLAGIRGADPKELGAGIAKLAKEKKIAKVVFDRGGYIYTGKVRALAESAREAGLEF
ncbi:MAG: 50S ribosomal protein L18 [bacterium]|nr:50S ribosomal protein L18 [bacterium]